MRSPSSPQLFFHCYDTQSPGGGQKQVYDDVDALNARGLRAYVFHGQPGFRLSWFDNQTRIVDLREFRKRYVPQRDYLVLPEVICPEALKIPGRKIIYDKSLYFGFARMGPETRGEYLLRRPDVVATFAVSEHSAHHLRFVFPKAQIHVIHTGLDVSRFSFVGPSSRKSRILVMPKNRLQTYLLMHTLLARAQAGLNGLGQWEWIILKGFSQEQIRNLLAESQWLLHLSSEEGGFPRMLIEAMLSGCRIATFDTGVVGALLPPSVPRFSYGDTLGLARAIEASAKSRPADLRQEAISLRASRKFAESYTLASAGDDAVAAWEAILRSRHAKVARWTSPQEAVDWKQIHAPNVIPHAVPSRG